MTADTKLITVGLGGNDIGYNGTALACGDATTVCAAPPTLAADEAALPGKLDAMLAALEAKAPKATIVVVTYPREFPKTNCPALSLTDEELADRAADGRHGREGPGRCGQEGGRAARRSVRGRRGPHRVPRRESKRWAAGNPVTDGFAYHPTALGHQKMAALISKALNG